MDIYTFDWETYWADDYTLSKMTTESYVRDPRFEEILCSVKINAAPAFWLLPDRLADFIAHEVDWSNVAMIAQHAQFDGLILSHHHGKRPAFWIDTLSMARVIDGPKAPNDLASMLIRHGLREKGNYVTYAKNKHLADFTRDELRQYGEYSCNDSEGTYDLAQIFLPQLPGHELQLIDLTIRMFTEPIFVGDTEKLRGAVASERQRKIELLRRINLICPSCFGNGDGAMRDFVTDAMPTCKHCLGTGVDKKPIGSNEKFADLLRAFDIEPELKNSPTAKEPDGSPKQIYAFAKTDSAMQELLEHPDEQVRFLAEARIGVKSNIIETRAQRFLNCAERGVMPVYGRHAGAHTLRISGGDAMNWFNMSNYNAFRPEMAVLKESIQVSPGHLIVAADSGQGEARILAWLAKQLDLLEQFAQKRDVYSEYASGIYARKVDRKRKEVIDGKEVFPDYIPGQLGKVSILGLGFGMGWYKAAMELLKGMLGAPPIQFTIDDMKLLNVDPSAFLNNPHKVAMVGEMPSRLELNDRFIHCIVTESIVKGYRTRFQQIAGKQGFWNLMESVINAMIDGREMVFGAHGVYRTAKDKILGPTGLWLDYRGLQRDEHGGASYFNGRTRTKLHGPLLTENIVQHTHRLVVCEQALTISQRYKVALLPYDEVVCVVPENQAEEALSYNISVLATTPAWATGLPLMAEGGIGKTYAEAK